MKVIIEEYEIWDMKTYVQMKCGIRGETLEVKQSNFYTEKKISENETAKSISI